MLAPLLVLAAIFTVLAAEPTGYWFRDDSLPAQESTGDERGVVFGESESKDGV